MPPGLPGAPPGGDGSSPAPNKVQKVKVTDVWTALEKSMKNKKDGQEDGRKV
jgi:hypothetical protein